MIYLETATYIINRVLPRGRMRGRISGGVGRLNHIWQVSVPVMAALLWGLQKRQRSFLLHNSNVRTAFHHIQQVITCCEVAVVAKALLGPGFILLPK